MKFCQNIRLNINETVGMSNLISKQKNQTLMARTGSEELWFLANDTHSPSTSDSVFTLETASFELIPNFMARTIYKGFEITKSV